MPGSASERSPLLPSKPRRRGESSPLAIALFCVLFFLAAWVLLFNGWNDYPWYSQKRRSLAPLPKDPLERATALLERFPLIDGHIDLPIQIRARYSNHIEEVDLMSQSFPGHVTIPTLREGRVGGFFYSAYVPCAINAGEKEGVNFTDATWRVRDTLEQIDISKLIMQKYPETFQLALSANGIRGAFENGKIASLIGIEGAHQLGNSLGVLRMYYDLGVRYITLTHTCNNAFAGSCGFEGRPIQKYGLTSLGHSLIREMNRLGMLVDVSHTSEETARDALHASRAPVIFSHSNARDVWNVPRNVPDDVLRLAGKKGALVMATFAPQFVSQHEDGSGKKATLELVADHIEHIAKMAGRSHVGIGSDFDGIGSTPTGLENVSKYPYLMAELIRRGWTDDEIVGLAGGNLIKVMERAEEVAASMKDVRPGTEVYKARDDLPMHWYPN